MAKWESLLPGEATYLEKDFLLQIRRGEEPHDLMVLSYFGKDHEKNWEKITYSRGDLETTVLRNGREVNEEPTNILHRLDMFRSIGIKKYREVVTVIEGLYSSST